MLEKDVEEIIIEFLKKEIEWCKENPSDYGDKFDVGFVRGLEQAIYLIRAVSWH